MIIIIRKYLSTGCIKRRLELEVSGYSRPFQQTTEICASRPVGLVARLEQVTFNGSTSSAPVYRVIWTNHHSAINQHPSQII